MPDSQWLGEFSVRLQAFSALPGTGEPVSIKIRVSSGCFHREHSPEAYTLIDRALADLPHGEFAFEEHESGPELLVYVAAVSGAITLVSSVINLVVAILNARREGIKRGDRPNEALDLIVRKMDDGEFKERPVLTVSSSKNVSRDEVERALISALRDLIKEDRKVKKK